jgi:hypothetical protein
MKTLSGKHYSFKQVTQFPLQNKVLDLSASNIHPFLARDAMLVPFT